MNSLLRTTFFARSGLGLEWSTFLVQQRYKTNNRAPKPQYRKERAAKVLKVDLPDYQEMKRDASRSVEEVKADLKRKGILPPRQFTRPILLTCTGDILEPYKPPEGDGIASVLSTAATQGVTEFGKKGKSYLEERKVRKFEPDFEKDSFAIEAQNIYMESQELLQDVKRNKARLHDLVTEKAFPDMTWRLEKCTFRWNFLESLEAPRVVHIRTAPLMKKDNLFAQVTVRMHTRQTLAIYDRFGRLTFGSEHTVKDCIEYVVFEKYISEEYSSWRVHGKVIPDWLDKPEGMLRTMKQVPMVEEAEDTESEEKLIAASDTPTSPPQQPQLAAA